MLTDVDIINNGLGKVSASKVIKIDPPSTELEAFCAARYPQWKRSELAKRRWVFALEDDYELTLSEVKDNVSQPYKYPLPIDCLRPVRGKYDRWKQRGKFLYSESSRLIIDYIKDVDESEFDVLFNDVLSGRIAYEVVEYQTQSNKKKEDAKLLHYDSALKEAALANAFIIGPEDIASDDGDFSFVNSRYA
jgi:hypothetical protein